MECTPNDGGHPTQEVWSGVALKQRKLDDDHQALNLSESLLQQHQRDAADDAAPLK